MESMPMFSQSQIHHTQDYHKDMTNSTSSYPVWSNFFLSAGIPNTVAHEYAVTFSQHRIRIDMLKEITKEILLDMGIKAMGDIIAILRHAKNLCTQDELKGGTKITQPTVTNTMIPQKQSTVNQLAQRTPITTSRNGSSISSLVGNKVQSRVNLSSGALKASSNSSTTHINSNNKRFSSTISNSLAKRLKPSVESRNMPEKTLTVHYPSGSAIAKAQQRVLGKTAKTPAVGSVSIKSRLGSIDAANRNGPNISLNQHGNRQNKSNTTIRSSKDNSFTTQRMANSFPDRRRDDSGRTNQTRNQPGRLKSTVFKRLGD